MLQYCGAVQQSSRGRAVVQWNPSIADTIGTELRLL